MADTKNKNKLAEIERRFNLKKFCTPLQVNVNSHTENSRPLLKKMLSVIRAGISTTDI